MTDAKLQDTTYIITWSYLCSTDGALFRRNIYIDVVVKRDEITQDCIDCAHGRIQNTVYQHEWPRGKYRGRVAQLPAGKECKLVCPLTWMTTLFDVMLEGMTYDDLEMSKWLTVGFTKRYLFTVWWGVVESCIDTEAARNSQDTFRHGRINPHFFCIRVTLS